MGYGMIPVRTTDDPNAAADINQLMDNDEFLKDCLENGGNLLINSQFRWWQRGTSFTNVTNGLYTADRWKTQKANGSGTAPNFNIENDNTDGINYYLKITPTSTGTLGASMAAGVHQLYEYYATMKGKTVSARARFKAPLDKSFRWILWDGVGSVNVGGTGTGDWQEVVIEGFAISSSATQLGLYYQFATSTNFIPAINDYHYIDRVQVTEGVTALPFIAYDEIVDYHKCLRYYEKSYLYANAPGTASAFGRIAKKVSADANLYEFATGFTEPKRIIPTVTWYAVDGTAGELLESPSTNRTVNSTSYSSDKKAGYPVISVTPDAGDLFMGYWTADAEI